MTKAHCLTCGKLRKVTSARANGVLILECGHYTDS